MQVPVFVWQLVHTYIYKIFWSYHHERNLKEREDKYFEVKRRLKEAYKDFAHKKKLERSLFRFCRKKAWKKVIKILLKRSLKEGNKDKKEENKDFFSKKEEFEKKEGFEKEINLPIYTAISRSNGTFAILWSKMAFYRGRGQ